MIVNLVFRAFRTFFKDFFFGIYLSFKVKFLKTKTNKSED